MGYIEDIRKKVGHDGMLFPASAGFIVKDNKVLLQKRADNKAWGLHGGYFELGETCLEALEREIKEELNITPINPEFYKVYSGEDLHFVYPSKDEVYAVVILYIIREYEGELIPNHEEVLELKWFDFDDLPENLNTSDINIIKDVISYLKNNEKACN